MKDNKIDENYNKKIVEKMKDEYSSEIIITLKHDLKCIVYKRLINNI